MVQGDEGERAKSPEHKGMSEAGKGALPDYLGLAYHFPEEPEYSLGQRTNMKVRVGPGSENVPDYFVEAYEEKR